MNLGQFGDARYFHKYVSACYWYEAQYRNERRWAKVIRFIKSNRILLWRQSVCDFVFRHEVAGVRYRDYSLPLCIYPILKII